MISTPLHAAGKPVQSHISYKWVGPSTPFLTNRAFLSKHVKDSPASCHITNSIASSSQYKQGDVETLYIFHTLSRNTKQHNQCKSSEHSINSTSLNPITYLSIWYPQSSGLLTQAIHNLPQWKPAPWTERNSICALTHAGTVLLEKALWDPSHNWESLLLQNHIP